MKKIIKTVNEIHEFDEELFNKLNIGVEIQDFTAPNFSMKEIRDIINRYKEKLKGFQGLKSLHGPFLDLKPASPDFKIREVSYTRYLNALNIATELDFDYIIFHSQINPYLNEAISEDYNNQQSKEFWEKILKETTFKGTILVENVFEESPEMLRKYIETIDNPSIKINLDIGHAKLGKVSLEEWIKCLGKYIEYIHIHSNNGLNDEHKEPSIEEIKNLYTLLDRYNIDPVLSLEYKMNNIEEQIKLYF